MKRVALGFAGWLLLAGRSVVGEGGRHAGVVGEERGGDDATLMVGRGGNTTLVVRAEW